MLDVKVRNKEVKQILSKIFGNKNVSVVGGRGTAYGWCEISINIPKNGCTGDVNENGYPEYCHSCRSKIQQTSRQAEEAIKNVAFSQYYDDENYLNDKQIISIHLN